MTFHIKLGHLSSASLSSLVKCLQVSPQPIRVKVLHSKVGSWPYPQTGLPGTNALA